MQLDKRDICLTLFDAIQYELGVLRIEIAENYYNKTYEPYAKIFTKIVRTRIQATHEDIAVLINRSKTEVMSLEIKPLTFVERDLLERTADRFEIIFNLSKNII